MTIQQPQIESLNILVHPGFDTDPDLISHDDLPRLQQESEKLWQKWEDYALSLPDTSLLVIILHTDSVRQTREDILEQDKYYIRKVRKLRQALGRKLVVISDMLYMQNQHEIVDEIKKIFKIRGYNLENRNLEVNIFGTAFCVCVQEYANIFAGSGITDAPINIITELTEEGQLTDERRQDFQKDFGKIILR